MPISHEHECIFVHIPKTGGTSIEHMLSLFGDWRIEDRDRLFGLIQTPDLISRHWTTHFLQHLSISQISSLISSSVLKRYFSFSWVRNPWDRMVSIYTNKDPDMLNHGRQQGLFLEEMSFEEFVFATSNFTHVHLLDQTSFVTDTSGNIQVDFIGRFETFAADIVKLSSFIGIELTLPHKNISVHLPYKDYYNTATQQEISCRYARDIDLFSYTF